MENIRLGELLMSNGFITEEDLQQAIVYQKEQAQKSRIGDVLITLKKVTEGQVLEALAQKLRIEKISFNDIVINLDAVNKIPKRFALKYCLIAIDIKNDHLIVVLNDPLDYYALEDIKQIVNMPIQISLCEKASILRQIEAQYAELEVRAVTTQLQVEEVQPEVIEETTDSSSEQAVVKMLNTLLAKGFTGNASDIHIEPFEKMTKVRLRIDSMAIDYLTLDKAMHSSLIARIKIMSGMDIAEKRIPQDGHFKEKVEGYVMNVRTSVIPTIYGEKAVMRFLNTNTRIDNSETFGMNEHNYNRFMKIMENPNGLVYITGPTGSGKTTTLYMAISMLAKRPVNISTIEDPVEKEIANVNQMQVNNMAGLTFESGLRALLRQDPDIMMVGETRDEITAAISVRAAITGHLVVSTIHTNDALSTIVRLEDMKIEPYLVANSVVGLVAQRLLRKICPNCKEAYVPTKEQLTELDRPIKKFYHGAGCHVCNNTGYKGRIAIHEVVVIDKKIKQLIATHAPMQEIYDYVFSQQGYMTLKQNAEELVANGDTTIEEMLKITNFVGK